MYHIHIERLKAFLGNKKERDFLLFVLGINCGLRISDLLNLKVSDVINKNVVELFEQKTGKYKRFPITPMLRGLINMCWVKMMNNGFLKVKKEKLYY